jgi:hypothetical protein
MAPLDRACPVARERRCVYPVARERGGAVT